MKHDADIPGVAFARRNRDYSFAIPKRAIRAAIRMALLSKFQDRQALIIDGLAPSAPKTKVVAQVLRAISRPDLTEAEATVSVGETKAKALDRTLERRSILIGLPGLDGYSIARRLRELADHH